MKNRLIPMLMLLLVTTMTAKANPVDMQTVREVAVKFVNANTRTPLRGTEDLQLVTTYQTDSDDAAFHIFNTPNGFVIVSADDCAMPILGYSDEGRPFDLENIPIQLQGYLQGFVEQIQYGIENRVQDETTTQQWALVRGTGRLNNNRDGEAVEPLVTSMWGQDCLYNAMCPEDSSGPCGHVPTGCVATSFAQIMHYWGYPINGMGSHAYSPTGYPEQTVNFSATTYDWANMPNSLSSSSSSTQINAVATLMWHCGVAVDMGYGPDASGALSTDVATALLNYFGYSDELSIVYRSNYSDADWLSLMKNCLDLGCPIHYSGSDAYANGHAFVCDGYDSNDLLHFNWGWNGFHNGYFLIGALNPGGHSYNLNNKAIINIHPGCTYGTTYQITATTESSIYGTVSGSGTYNCGNVCTVTATANAGYGFKYWTENDVPVSTDANYSFVAMTDRNLVAHFGLPFNITTSANPSEGGTVTGGSTCYYNQHVTLTAVPNEGYVFDKWTKDGEDFSYYSTLNMNVTEAAEYVAYFEPLDGIEIGVPMSTNAFLPTYSHHSLTQQIYTANEMGGTDCQISSVSFFNTETSTRCNLSIYMVNTDKTAFNSTNDWITVTEADQVFSGSVTMAAKSWTTIYFPTPFSYDGSSNLALIIDNNAISYNNGNVFCRTFSTNEYQAICINSLITNYDPYNPSAYTGTRIKSKNHVVFGIPSYDYTVTVTANPTNGGMVSGGGSCYLNHPITLTASSNPGYVFNNWTKDGTVVSYLSTYSLTVTESAEYVANFEAAPNGIVIGNPNNTSYYLPTFYDYSLSEQIYTSIEMGGAATEISSVSFFNAGNYSEAITRNMSIYMVNTDKTSFDSVSDWIPVTESDLVFSGNVTFTAYSWTTVYFSTPFNYDGFSNVALIVDDNTSYYYVSTSCRTFVTEENQAIRVSSSGTNFDPANPSGYTGTLMLEKNQVIFGIPSYDYTITTTVNPSNSGTVSGGGPCYPNQSITLTATASEGYIFSNWTKNGEVVSYLSHYNLTVTENAEYVANFETEPDGIVIGDGTYANSYLPTYSSYSLSEQIYTANEMGGAATGISSVSFFNVGNYNYSITRNLSIYMVNTDKVSFEGTSDWIPVSDNDLVFSGNVTFNVHDWVTIYFNTPFNYDGTSNVALIVDDNSNNNNTSTSCRTFATGGNQAIRIYSSGTNYDPTNPSEYLGTLMPEKNQVIFGIPSYDYTVTVSVGSDGGGTVSGGGPGYLNRPITLTATPNEGYVFINWTKDGTVVSYLSTYSLTVTESAEYVANFQEVTNGFVIGDATYINSYLPIKSYYSLSEQIYTSNEMGGAACQISSVSFFNTGTTNKTRTISVYMVNTDKTSFESTSDWIPVTENDLVFSGNITFNARGWSTIYFSTPFNYEGSSNVALIVDDNSNSNNTYTSCRTFMTGGNQAIRISGSGTNYDPTNPSGYSGALMQEKNQVIFRWSSTVTATANPTGGGTVSGFGSYAYGATCTLTATPNTGYFFLNWTENGTVVSYDATYSFTANGDRDLVANFIEGESMCFISVDLYDSYGDGWNGNCLVIDYGDGNQEQLTLESGSSTSFVREVVTDSHITLTWIPSSYFGECSFDVKFENGVPIYHGSGLSSSFQQELYINCAVASAPYVIAAVADPEEGGTVEGAGTYNGGTIITLTAIPNNGYTFCYWSENGQQVSTDASYSFIVSSDRNLVARFSLPLTVSVTTNIATVGTVTGAGVFDYGNTCTLTATPNEGYLFLNWSKNGEVVSCNATYSFAVTEDIDLEAVFMPLEGNLIGQGEATSSYLPSYSYYYYTLSQQIYTPEEIGESGTITSISYYNGSETKTRTYDIYMVHTDKTIFENDTAWISVSETDLVYSGSVTLTQGYWTTIDLDTPFAYNGTSNLAIIVDDNTGTMSRGMACRVFNSNGNQAIRICSYSINYDPNDLSGYYGARYNVKNQIILGITSTFTKEINPYTPNGGYYLISVPVDEVAPADVGHMLDNNYDLYAFDESQELQWLNYKNAGNGFANLVAGRGYLYANSDTLMLNFTGVPYDGDGRVTLHKTGDGETAGWNLVGNPFNEIAYIDREFYVMSADGSKIELAQRNYVLPMEGVFVIANEDGEVLVFRTGDRK